MLFKVEHAASYLDSIQHRNPTDKLRFGVQFSCSFWVVVFANVVHVLLCKQSRQINVYRRRQQYVPTPNENERDMGCSSTFCSGRQRKHFSHDQTTTWDDCFVIASPRVVLRATSFQLSSSSRPWGIGFPVRIYSGVRRALSPVWAIYFSTTEHF